MECNWVIGYQMDLKWAIRRFHPVMGECNAHEKRSAFSDTVLAPQHQANISCVKEAAQLPPGGNKDRLLCSVLGSGQSQTRDGEISTSNRKIPGTVPTHGSTCAHTVTRCQVPSHGGHMQAAFGNAPSFKLTPELPGNVQGTLRHGGHGAGRKLHVEAELIPRSLCWPALTTLPCQTSWG